MASWMCIQFILYCGVAISTLGLFVPFSGIWDQLVPDLGWSEYLSTALNSVASVKKISPRFSSSNL